MKLKQQNWGEVEGQSIPVQLFTLENSQGLSLAVMNYGCIVTSIEVPDRDGQKADVVLGYENLDKYLQGHPFFGAVAGRYANRIENGCYTLDDQSFELETNEPLTGQHLHGGRKGFDKYVWNFAVEQQQDAIFIHFSRVSSDGESGYGGNLVVTHTIGLDESNQIHFNFRAITDKPTVVNLCNHSYYNLAGHDSGTVDGHTLKLYAQFYTPVSENAIPTGEICSVLGTGLDFTQAKRIAENKACMPDGGFDHNLIIDASKYEGEYKYAAELYDSNSGRMMTVLTTQPGIQFYNGYKLSNKQWLGRHGERYESCYGMCLETQHFPDSPNKAHFPSTRLNPGEVYEEKTIHRFSVK
ncbi:galactose mutarotase [Salinivibrio kushneri]|uniref:Aldose 1-epimerase n=1 Tax=Salinivibrio kushneri TaxID=1908198 RepID=A0AB36K5K0_9GAMM|nr:aldose epimerase family protein [Salinivibrio kushneri]OOE43412.1 galactose mutarotase [Salinivibrio kushneri]OOE45348.1 galactose mutarotase [Salinivibrio kushneri]